MTSLQCFDRVLCSQEKISSCLAFAQTYNDGFRLSSACAASGPSSSGATTVGGPSADRPRPLRFPPTAPFFPAPAALCCCFWRPFPFLCPPWPPTPFLRAGRLLLFGGADAARCASVAGGEAFSADGDGGDRGCSAFLVGCRGTGGYILSQFRFSRIRCEDMQAIRRRTTACRWRVLQFTRRA